MRAHSQNKSDYKSRHTRSAHRPYRKTRTEKLRVKFIVRFSSKTIILWDLIECDRMVFVWLSQYLSLTLPIVSHCNFTAIEFPSLSPSSYQLALLKYQIVSSYDRFTVNKNAKCRIRSQYNLKAISRANDIAVPNLCTFSTIVNLQGKYIMQVHDTSSCKKILKIAKLLNNCTLSHSCSAAQKNVDCNWTVQ